MTKKMAGHCARGHRLDDENLYVWYDARRNRTIEHCRACQRLRYREQKGLEGDGHSRTAKPDECTRGHKLTPENCRVTPKKGRTQYRACRKCEALRNRKYRAAGLTPIGKARREIEELKARIAEMERD